MRVLRRLVSVPAVALAAAGLVLGGRFAGPFLRPQGNGEDRVQPRDDPAQEQGQADTGAAEPVGYMRRLVHDPVFICSGTLSSTAAAKTASSVVDAFISNFSSTKPCSGVVQESVNGGKTWHDVSATHAIPAPEDFDTIVTMGFTARYADGKGRLARVCITESKKRYRTKGW